MTSSNHKIKVTLFIRNFHTLGGLQKYANYIVEGFVKKGALVHVISSDSNTNSKFHPSITFHKLKLQKRLNFKKVKEFDTLCQNWNQKNPSDIVFGMDRTRDQSHIRAGNGVHAAFIKTRENYSSFRATFNPINKTILQIEKDAFENPNLKVLFTNSYMVKKQILKYYNTNPSTIEVIHNGVEWHEMDSAFNSWFKKKEALCTDIGTSPYYHQFLFIGNGYERKGLLNLLEALSLISSKNFHLSVIGKEKNINYFIKQTKKLGLSKCVSYFGPRKDIRQFYQIADTLVVPSLYDPFANVTVEALAMGLFVVSSDTNGGHEILSKETGIVVTNIKKPESFAHALSIAIKRPKTQESSKKIRDSVRYLDFSNQITKLVDASLKRL